MLSVSVARGNTMWCPISAQVGTPESSITAELKENDLVLYPETSLLIQEKFPRLVCHRTNGKVLPVRMLSEKDTELTSRAKGVP